MPDPTEPTPPRRSKSARPRDLKQFLGGPSKPADALSYHELQGFLFAVVSAPEMVPPSDWVPMVLGQREPAFQSADEARRLLGELMQLYNDLNAQVLENAVALPGDCRFRGDALSNLAEDTPISQWSRGFIRGHTWLGACWEPLPNEVDQELGAVLMTLSFFASRRIAEGFEAECKKSGKTLAEIAETCRTLFPDAMVEYARIGRCIDQAQRDVQSGRAAPIVEKVGRNDPCPCGSGKKHKKCCAGAPADLMEQAARRVRRVQNDAEPKVARYLRSAVSENFMDLAHEDFERIHSGLDPRGPELQLFVSWILYDWIPATPGSDTRAPARRLLDEHGAGLASEEREFLQRTGDTPLSFHEVLEVEPGRRLRMRDVLLGTELEVYEQSGSSMLRVGDIVYARVVPHDGAALIIGSGATVLPPIEKRGLIQLRERLRKELGAPTQAAIHSRAGELRRLYLEVRERLMNPVRPTLVNTDGEPFEFHTITCDVESTEAAFEALASLARGRTKEELLRKVVRDENGRLDKVEIPWLKGKGGPSGDTILGDIHLEGSTLKAHVNSAARSRRLQKELRKRLGTSMRNLAVGIKPVEEALADHRKIENTPEERERRQRDEEWRAQPEIREAMRQALERQWDGWLGERIPALDDRTPREAVRSPEGREMVEALLLQFERHGASGEESYDFNRLRRKLGLPEQG